MSQTDGPEYAPGAGVPPPPPGSSGAGGPSHAPNMFVDGSGASLWVRGLYMLLFGVVAYVLLWLLFFTGILQLVVFLVMAKPNEELRHFGREILQYLRVVVSFLVFLEDKKPFPFSPFPSPGDPPPP